MVGELISKWLEERPLIRKIFPRFIKTQQVVDVRSMIDKKKEEWINRGVAPKIAEMGAYLAMSWAHKISQWHMRHLKDILPKEELDRIEKELFMGYLKEGLEEVAEKWVKTMGL